MKRIGVWLMALLPVAALAGPADKATFDVASIRAAESGRENIQVVPGSVTMKSARLVTAIRWAYDILEYQVSGPAWISEGRFDITAKAATPAKEAEMRLMMQTLLAERFKLTIHHQTKELSALVLTVGKNGHKLTPVETEGNPSFSTGKLTLTGKGATVNQLIQFLSREIRNPIVDQTGLTGRYDYFVDINTFVTEEIMKGAQNGGPPPEAPSIIAQALQGQLGLKLDPKKVPMDTVVVDSVEKTPTEN